MTVYARSDLASVILSADHGGCGEVHSRPVVNGAPVKLWALTCVQCEDSLRSDSLWSSTVSEIPETPDETSIREDQNKRGVREQQDATAHALEQLGKLGDLPAVLGQFMQYLTTGKAPEQIESGPVIVATPETSNQEIESFGHAESEIGAEDGFDDMKLPDLQALAKSQGKDTARSRVDQIAILRGEK